MLEKRFFYRYRKYFGSKLYLFPCKNYSFWGLLFSVFWFVKHHSFKSHVLHFQLNYECDVIFAVSQICAYFVDNPHNLEIDSFKIAVSEHILLYFKNSNSFFLCTHNNVRHTCHDSWCTLVFDRKTFHILPSDMCIPFTF
jgi:hypothetical protein